MQRRLTKRASSRPQIFIDPRIYNNLPEVYSQVEVYVQEARKLLKYSQYRKCFLTMDAQLQKLETIPCPIQLRIRLCRRLLYCSSKILMSYLHQEEDLQTRQTQLLFNRIIFYLQNYALCLTKIIQGESLKDVCLIKLNQSLHTVNDPENMKNKKLILFYTKEFISYLEKTFVLKSEYFKRVSMEVKGVRFLYSFVENSLFVVLQERPIMNQGEMLNMFKGSFYFNLREYKLSQDSYKMALTSCQKSLNLMLNKKSNRKQQPIQIQVHKALSQIALSLFMLSFVYEFSNQYEMCIESVQMATWFCTTFLSHINLELHELIQQRNYVSVCYDIKLTLIRLLDLKEEFKQPIKEADGLVLENYNKELYAKLHVKQLNQDSYIMQKSHDYQLVELKKAYYPQHGVSLEQTCVLTDLDLVAIEMKILKTQSSEYVSGSKTQLTTGQTNQTNQTKDDLHNSCTRMQTTINQTGHIGSQGKITNSNVVDQRQIKKSILHTQVSDEEKDRPRKLMKSQNYYTLPDDQEEELKQSVDDVLNERRILNENITESFLKDALKKVYLNMIQSKFGKKELQSHRAVFEKRLLSQFQIEQTFQDDIVFAKGETSLQFIFMQVFKKIHQEKQFQTSYYTTTSIKKNIKDREDAIIMKNEANSLIVQKQGKLKKNSMDEVQTVSTDEAVAKTPNQRFKSIVLDHSKSLGFTHLKKELRQHEIIELQDDQQLDETQQIQKTQNNSRGVNKMMMEHYEQLKQPLNNKQRVLKQMLHPDYVSYNTELAKSTAYTRLRREKRKKIGSFSDLILLSAQLTQSRKLKTVEETTNNGHSPLVPNKFLALLKKKR